MSSLWPTVERAIDWVVATQQPTIHAHPAQDAPADPSASMTGPDVALFESATSASIPGRLVLLLSIPLPSRAEAASLSVEPQASVLRSGNAPHQLPWSEVTIRNEAQDSVTVTVGFNKHEIEVVPEKVGAIVGGGEVTIKTRLTGRTARTAPLGSLLVIGGKELIRIPISIDPPTVKSWQLTTYFGWPIGHDRRGTFRRQEVLDHSRR